MLKKGWGGIKTGITDTAGPCLSTNIKIKNKDTGEKRYFVIVVLNCKSSDHRWEEVEKLAKWAVRNTS